MNTTFDDADSHIVYSSNPSWRTDLWLEQSPQSYRDTVHRTQNSGAIATFTFTGVAVYAYGHKASDHGYRDISIDGATPTRCDGRTGSQGSRVILYWQDGLSPGTHVLTLQHTGEPPQWLNFDYFVVTSAGPETTSQTTSVAPTNVSPTSTSPTEREDPTGAGARSTSSPSPLSTGDSSQSSPNAIIIGVVVAAAVIAICITIIWYFCIRDRRKAKQQAEERKDAATPAWNPTAAVHGGIHPSPHITEPLNPYDLNSGPPDSNATRNINTGHWGPHNPSWHYSQEGRQSTYSTDPSTYSGPPNQPPPFQYLPPPVTNPVSNVPATPYNWHPALWTSGSSIQTSDNSNQTRMESPIQTKARYSGANESKARYLGAHSAGLSSSSSSRPLSPSTINELVTAPPQYEK